jgi:hypothetical protein
MKICSATPIDDRIRQLVDSTNGRVVEGKPDLRRIGLLAAGRKQRHREKLWQNEME